MIVLYVPGKMFYLLKCYKFCSVLPSVSRNKSVDFLSSAENVGTVSINGLGADSLQWPEVDS